jgi:hypothetical protein
MLEDNSAVRKKNQPRQNAVGEVRFCVERSHIGAGIKSLLDADVTVDYVERVHAQAQSNE